MSGIVGDPTYHTQVYQTEVYTIDYANLKISNGFSGKFGLNIINNESIFLRYGLSFFFEIYSDEVEYTLVDIGAGDTVGHANLSTTDIPLGYQNSAIFDGFSFGGTNELLLLKKLKNGYAIGGGLSHFIRRKNDQPTYFGQYVPWGYPNEDSFYTTQQLAVSAQLEKKFERLSWSINVAQTFLTTKLRSTKGAAHFPNGASKHVISHNLDYRFPLVLQLSVAYNFARIKNR